MAENEGIKLVGGGDDDPKKRLDPAERILCPSCGCDRRETPHGYSIEGVNLPGVAKVTQMVVYCQGCRVQIAFVILAFEPLIAPGRPGSRYEI